MTGFDNTLAGGWVFIETKVLFDATHQLSSTESKNTKGHVIGKDPGVFVYRTDHGILHVTRVDVADESISRLQMEHYLLIGTAEEVTAGKQSFETHVGSANYIH